MALLLTDLTKKDRPTLLEWTDECDRAFNQLKKLLCSDPVLRSPDFDREFVLQTDASNRGIGAVLSQLDSAGQDHPIAYFSRKLLPREEKYSTVEKECLSINWPYTTFVCTSLAGGSLCRLIIIAWSGYIASRKTMPRKEVLERKELKKATKMRVYHAIVLPTMLYGSETWTVMKRHESRLGATEMAYLRRVEGVTRKDQVRNADVREAVGQEEVMEKVKRKQRAWKEKLEQMEDSRLVKKVYTEEIAGKRPLGRPRKKWIDSF